MPGSRLTGLPTHLIDGMVTVRCVHPHRQTISSPAASNSLRHSSPTSKSFVLASLRALHLDLASSPTLIVVEQPARFNAPSWPTGKQKRPSPDGEHPP